MRSERRGAWGNDVLSFAVEQFWKIGQNECRKWLWRSLREGYLS
jgi:hypothetical protein